MKNYDVFIDVTGVIIYQVRANSPEEAVELVQRGDFDDYDFQEWSENPDSLEVVERDYTG
jgi:hypothetical protein